MKLKLSTRIILFLILAQAMMLVVLVANSTRLINASHTEILARHIKETNQLLSIALRPSLLAKNKQDINHTLSLLADNSRIAYIVVQDINKQVLAQQGLTSHELKEYLHQAEPQQQTRKLDKSIYHNTHNIMVDDKPLATLKVGYSVEQIKNFITESSQQNSSLAIASLLLSIFISVVAGLALTRNLETLKQGAQALENGELDHRINLDSKDEIGDVARSLNKLAKHLQLTQASLKDERAALETEATRLETLLNGVNAVLLEINPYTHNFTYVSEGALDLLGYETEKWLQPDFWINHIHPDDQAWVTKTIMHKDQQPGDYYIDYRMRNIDHEYTWVRSIHSIEMDSNGFKQSHALMLDVTEQKQAEDRIIYLAERDALTGLLNRRRFQEELETRIAYAKRFNQPGALLFIDLDEFKYINDTLGHQSGDDCLLTISRCLAEAIRETDVIARLGGDEFAVILPRTDPDDAIQVAQNLITILEAKTLLPVELSMRISASIGITLFPKHGVTPSELLAKADAAMYSAKRNGKNQVHVFENEDSEMLNMQTKMHWEDRIRRALDEDGFVLHYQPVYNLRNGEISHYEALVRMKDTDDKLIFPSEFLATAERFNLVQEIDKWVLRKGIETQAESIRKGKSISIAINLSGRHFGNEEVMRLVKNTIREYNADASCIIFEVTETAAVDSFHQARSFIESLRSLGCRFALDDFGMGYSSFHYLKNLPVDMVKIDGSFVRNLHLNQFDRIIVKAMSDLASGMNIKTVAEFVENEEICTLLEKLGVDYGQGYHLGMPDPGFVHNRKSSVIQLR